MKILFCGDIVGRAGRDALKNHLPTLKKQHNIDFTIANCDNASGGFGINNNGYNELVDLGINALTGGDHIWDQGDIGNFINNVNCLIRPLNFPVNLPGVGFKSFEIAGLKKILVIHLLGQVFIKYTVNCPFEAVSNLLENNKLGNNYDAIFVDFHAEATSEKMAMAKFLDGKVSAVIGSHTHIPTNDFHIMKQGTAYQTDAGMCGDYDSVIGMDSIIPLKSFLQKRRAGKFTPAQGEPTLSGTIITINNLGLANRIEAVKIGGALEKVAI